MVQLLYSYDNRWLIVSNISTYKYIFDKIQDAPVNLWNNLTWLYISSSAFYAAFWDYLFMSGITLIYFTALKLRLTLDSLAPVVDC